MEDDWLEDGAAIRDAIDAFARRHLTAEYLAECDRQARYPGEAMAALAADGWSTLPVTEEYGGTSASLMSLVAVHEALARHSLVVAQTYFSMWVLGADALARLGTTAQQKHWLPLISKGSCLVAFALTEPDAGSDAAALRTSAVSSGGNCLVSGQKVFITGAAVSDVIVTAVRTRVGAKHAGISLLLIDPRSPGVTIRPLSKLGIKALDLCEVHFDGVEVPGENLLGTEDEGWAALRPGLARERILLAWIAGGGPRDVLATCLAHAQARVAFAKTI